MLSQWTPRRLAVVWAAGIALQVVLVVAPAAFALHIARRDGARLHQQVIARDARLKTSEQADSASRVEQIANARAAGQFRLAPNGDTLHAVVSMPSGRTDPQRTAALRRSVRRTVGVVLGIQFGAIPLALIGLTLVWLLARRKADGLGAARRVV